MFNIVEAVKQYLVVTAVPFVTATITTWLVSAHVLSLFSISPTSAAKTIAGAITFLVVWAFNQLALHKILGGHFTPGARATLASGDRLSRATREGL